MAMARARHTQLIVALCLASAASLLLVLNMTGEALGATASPHSSGSGARRLQLAPGACCLAMTAECLSCSRGVSVEEFCEGNPTTEGCAPSGAANRCCRAMTAECLSCSQGISEKEFCSRSPTTVGCGPSGAAGEQQCCLGMIADCLSCQQGVSKVEFCKSRPATEGCQGWNLGGWLGQLRSHPYKSVGEGLKYTPQKAVDSWLESFLPFPPFFIYLAQAVFSVFYFCKVVSNYPYWNGPTPMSCQLQADPAPCATANTSPGNCFLSYFCPQARAAHTFDRTGVLDYWCGCLAMFFCPFCTLCWANACTDMNARLGGEPANVIASMACTWCCSCCTIAQDAESLDAATGARSNVCGVEHGVTPYGPGAYPHGGGGPMAGQMMMRPNY